MEKFINDKNVMVKSPKEGDILILDAAKKIKFIAAGTYDGTSFPAGATVVGVVANRQGNQVLAVNKTNTTKVWCSIYRWKITGFTLDGSDHVVKVSFYSSQAAPSNADLTYNGTSVDAIIPQFQAWFDAYKLQTGISYRCMKLDDETMTVIKDKYQNWYEYTLNISTLTVKPDVATYLPAVSSTYAKNGRGGECKGMNWDIFLNYMMTSESSTFNPSEPVEGLTNYPLAYKSYSSNIGDAVRAIYGTGEEAYKEYLKGYMIDFPSQRGVFAPELRSGHHNTYLMVAENYVNAEGATVPMFPAARYCADVAYENPLLASGKWYLPSIYEQAKMYDKVKLDYSDAINQSLTAIGGTRLYLAPAWSSSRYGSGYAWIFDGRYGCSNHNNFYLSHCAVPCVLLNLSECEI